MMELIITVAALGLTNFMLASGLLRALLNVFLGPFLPIFRYNRWISNIPGNPSNLDHLLCAFFG